MVLGDDLSEIELQQVLTFYVITSLIEQRCQEKDYPSVRGDITIRLDLLYRAIRDCDGLVFGFIPDKDNQKTYSLSNSHYTCKLHDARQFDFEARWVFRRQLVPIINGLGIEGTLAILGCRLDNNDESIANLVQIS